MIEFRLFAWLLKIHVFLYSLQTSKGRGVDQAQLNPTNIFPLGIHRVKKKTIKLTENCNLKSKL